MAAETRSQGSSGCDHRIDRVATGLKNLHACLGCQRLRSRHHAAAAVDDIAVRGIRIMLRTEGQHAGYFFS